MTMAVAKVALSFPVGLLDRVDRMARKSKLSRSAFVSRVLEQGLRQPAEAETFRRAHALYAEIGEADRALAEMFLPLAVETLPRQRRRRGKR
jgi:metal-responsive CopG/Arc/MetJ family transcriptional regulator